MGAPALISGPEEMAGNGEGIAGNGEKMAGIGEEMAGNGEEMARNSEKMAGNGCTGGRWGAMGKNGALHVRGYNAAAYRGTQFC
jgi:hypothetical protein